MAETAGIDFSWSHPDPRAVVQSGYRFVLGYLSRDPTKNMTPQLAQACRSAGLSVGLVWETGKDRVLSGAGGGAADGATAGAEASAVGYPKDCVIYLAVDYAEPASDFPATMEYCHAFNEATSHPVGIYGDYAVVDHFVTPGQQPVQSGWQTVAWSGGLVSAKADIYQRNTKHYPTIAGMKPNGYDENVLMHAGVKIWSSDTMVPPPPPPALPAHPPVLGWNLGPGNYFGNLAGPNESHGGANAGEKAFVRNIQQWLVYHGCASSCASSSWSSSGWADGIWGAPSDQACSTWHGRFYPRQPKPTQIWADDYARLVVP